MSGTKVTQASPVVIRWIKRPSMLPTLQSEKDQIKGEGACMTAEQSLPAHLRADVSSHLKLLE